jgi:RNA polymerase sigma factor (sigma-70 family)
VSLTLPDTIATLAQSGDRWATWQLLQLHDRAIKLHAGKAMASAQSMTLEDMQQEAVIGALELLKCWKPNSGCTFYSWLYTWLPHRLRRTKDMSDFIVKVPAWAGLKDRREGNQAIPFTTTLYAPSTNDDEVVLRSDVEASGNPLQPDYEARSDMAWLLRSIDQLPERERVAVRVTYFDEGTQNDLADAWGCTRQNVSQYAKTGVARLRRMAKAEK